MAATSKNLSPIGVRCVQLLLLNIADTLLTLFAVLILDPNCELNPLMAAIIATCPWFFATVKIGLGTILFWKLYKSESETVRQYGSILCLTLYWCVVIQNCFVIGVVKMTC